MPKIFDSIWKSKLTIPLAVVVVSSTTFLAVSHYKIGQTASVVSASCYLKYEVDGMEADKTALETQVSDLNDELTQINADLVANSENTTTAQSKIDDLNNELISDYAIEQKKDALDKIYNEKNDNKVLSEAQTDYNERYLKPISNSRGNLITLHTRIVSAKATSDGMFVQFTKAKEVDDTLTLMKLSKRALDNLTAQTLERQLLDKKGAEVPVAKKALDSFVRTSTRSNLNQYNLILGNYNKIVADYTKLSDAYRSKYPKFESYATVLAAKNSETVNQTKLATSYDKLNKEYNLKYPSKNPIPFSTLSGQYNTAINAYNQAIKNKTDFEAAITKLKAESGPIQSNIIALAKKYTSTYGYGVDSTIPTFAELEKKYNTEKSEYEILLAKNNNIKSDIEKLNAEKVVYETQKTELDNKFVLTQAEVALKNTKIGDLATAISNAGNNICPTLESQCTNGVDDDRDDQKEGGGQDCDDMDCKTDPACQVVDITQGDSAITKSDNNKENTDTNTNTNTDTNTDTNTGEDTNKKDVGCAAKEDAIIADLESQIDIEKKNKLRTGERINEISTEYYNELVAEYNVQSEVYQKELSETHIITSDPEENEEYDKSRDQAEYDTLMRIKGYMDEEEKELIKEKQKLLDEMDNISYYIEGLQEKVREAENRKAKCPN